MRATTAILRANDRAVIGAAGGRARYDASWSIGVYAQAAGWSALGHGPTAVLLVAPPTQNLEVGRLNVLFPES